VARAHDPAWRRLAAARTRERMVHTLEAARLRAGGRGEEEETPGDVALVMERCWGQCVPPPRRCHQPRGLALARGARGAQGAA